MLKLLKKEFVLAMHPITPIMMLTAAMVCIPNYPYSVAFFYLGMAIFFTCLLGRENRDILFSLSLPIAKRDVVKGRFAFTVVTQLVQLLLTVPFMLLRQSMQVPPNQAGMEANVALLAVGLIVFGMFNLSFFKIYYHNCNRVGTAFLVSSAVVFVFVVIEIVCTYAIPFVRDYLDTADPAHMPQKLLALAVGALVYAVATLIAYKTAVRDFDKQDM